ncbi:MAG: pyridoxal phosphate-dependent aminotransferase [Hydrogenophilales bacterium]|nr:pyridoxal phosphate-dependent aminotransferase [Hydrogenophilales bacterium]
MSHLTSKQPSISARALEIEAFRVMDILAQAWALEAQGRDIVHMEIGEPDFPTPEPIIAAGIEALKAGHTYYTPALGLPQLREAIAAFYAARYGVTISPNRVVVTPGSSGALLLTLAVLLNPGDEVLLTDPGYPCNRHFARFVEGRAVALPVTAATQFQPTAEMIAAHWSARTRAAMVATPANPTGTLLTLDQLRPIHQAVAARGGALVVDEIYHGLTYGCDAQTALALGDDVFVINSFSKYFGMTGWRLGWLIAPEAYVDALDRLAQNIFLAASTPAQHAALAAFHPDTLAILEERRAAFQARRDYLLPALRALGFDIPLTPEGAFYLYAGCDRFGLDAGQLTRALLNQAGVAITPGADFGGFQSSSHVRFAYTTTQDRLEQGVARIDAFLKTLA